MSLIRVRRRRKKQWMDSRQGMPARKLMGLLFMVLVAVWYLHSRY